MGIPCKNSSECPKKFCYDDLNGKEKKLKCRTIDEGYPDGPPCERAEECSLEKWKSCDYKTGKCTLNGASEIHCRSDSDCNRPLTCGSFRDDNNRNKCGIDGIYAERCYGADDECPQRYCSIEGQCIVGTTSEGHKKCDFQDECITHRCSEGKCKPAILSDGSDECSKDSDCPQRRPSGSPSGLPTTSPSGGNGALNRALNLESGHYYSDSYAELDSRQIPPEPAHASPEAVQKVLSERLKSISQGNPGELNFIGKRDAKVNVVMFQDLACHMCKRAYLKLIEPLRKDLIETGKVKITFMENPLGFMHTESKLAEAAKCAGAQGRYDKFARELYSNMDQVTLDNLGTYAVKAGLNTKKFNECRTSGVMAKAVRADYDAGQTLGVNGTPTFFINNVELRGAGDPEEFRSALGGAEGK